MPIEDSQVSVGGLVTIGLYFLFKKDSSLYARLCENSTNGSSAHHERVLELAKFST